MKQLFFLFAALVGLNNVVGTLSPGFRAKYPVFRAVPRTVEDAVADGWVTVARADDAYLPSLVMKCPADDYSYCTLYDDTEYLCGVQVALSVKNFTDPAVNMNSMGFKNWSASAFVGGEAAEYYTTNQFFISEETLAANASVRNALRTNNETLFEGGIWIPALNGTLTKISSSVSELDSIWTVQGCLAGMGQHYTYNVTSAGDCSQLYPWFVIFEDDELVATGFNAFGNLTTAAQGAENWFERVNTRVLNLTIPYAPQCVYDYANAGNAISLHVYYVDSPTNITCPA